MEWIKKLEQYLNLSISLSIPFNCVQYSMYFSKGCEFKYKNKISPKNLISDDLLRKKLILLCQIQYEICLRKVV